MGKSNKERGRRTEVNASLDVCENHVRQKKVHQSLDGGKGLKRAMHMPKQ